MFKKMEFYLLKSEKLLDDPKRFQEGVEHAYVNGIDITEYEKRAVNNSEDGSLVCECYIVKCRERWRGAAKRYFRMCERKPEFLNCEINGIPVYG